MIVDAHLFQPSSFYRGQYESFNGLQAEIKDNYLIVHVQQIVQFQSQKPYNKDDLEKKRKCLIIEDNEVYNERNSLQSYRLLLVDNPVEGKCKNIDSSKIGLEGLFHKDISGICFLSISMGVLCIVVLKYISSPSEEHRFTDLEFDLRISLIYRIPTNDYFYSFANIHIFISLPSLSLSSRLLQARSRQIYHHSPNCFLHSVAQSKLQPTT